MNKINKRVIIGIIGIIICIIVGICFYKALQNYQKNTTTTSSNTSQKKEEITEGGSYTITSNKECIVVNTKDSVELILENANITCSNGPAIDIISADEVTITLVGDNTITSTTAEDKEGAIFSKEDLILSGTGSLKVTSNYDGIVSKDNLTITGGTYIIESEDDGLKGKDNIEITDGVFTITTKGDGIKSTNDVELDKGSITISGGVFTINSVGDGIEAQTTLTIKNGTYTIKTTGNTSTTSAKALKAETTLTIEKGTFELNTTDDGIHSNQNLVIHNGAITINSKDDAIHADGMVEINQGVLTLTASEGIEGTYVKINDGEVQINATDDGINAGNKSTAYETTIEINGGNIKIKMGQGDTDGIDSNGNIYINGGTIDIEAQSPFDYDKTAKYTGGTIIVNGTITNQITNQMMGGGNMQGPNQGGYRRR